MQWLLHSMLSSLMLSRRDRLLQRMILNPEWRFWMKSLIGTKKMPWRSGLSVLIMLELTSLWKRLQEYNMLLNSVIPWKVHGNGPQKRLPCVKRIWEVLELTSSIVFSMLMPSTEEVVRSSQLQEDFTMHVNSQLSHSFRNPSSLQKSQLPPMPWEESTIVSTHVEVLSMRRNKLQEHPSTSSEPIFQSLNHSVSPLTWEDSLRDKHSLNVSSITGRTSVVIPLNLEPSHKNLSSPSERERDLSPPSPHLMSSSTDFE